MHKATLLPSLGMLVWVVVTCAASEAPAQAGRQLHVAVTGNDAGDGSKAKPLLTISAAAELAQPGDVITVHAGTYRERIDPPRGGTSDTKRIVYQTAKGEKVVIKGSEVVKGWKKKQNDTWKVTVPNTLFGDFNPFADAIKGDWFNPKGRTHHTGAVYLDGHWLIEAANREDVMKPFGTNPARDQAAPAPGLWFATVGEQTTTILAQFRGVDPNQGNVEINVRQSVFYPSKPGINYLTVRGFAMRHAATPWAPPTAEQVGLIGTHWSKGWTIEDNDIRYSVCTGITLGKHGDEFDNTSQNSATGYVETIHRALARGWSKENIGSHIVRNNRIAHCEQAGIVGSMGPIFSEVCGNEIHDIHVRRLFTGAEMGGIKFHGAIDTVIRDNHIYRTSRGIWLDWMTQGTRVTGNLLHDNGPSEDLFVEVNHGPFLVDNNFFLSGHSLRDWSQGGAYAHNLFAGKMTLRPVLNRETPYHPAHSTKVAGLSFTQGGDNRFYNNIFTGGGLAIYDAAAHPVFMGGNVFLNGAKPSTHEAKPVVAADHDPGLKLVAEADSIRLQMALDKAWLQHERPLVTTGLLGKARIPALPFVQPDDSPYRLDRDYLGGNRNASAPFPGPLEHPIGGAGNVQVWPKP